MGTGEIISVLNHYQISMFQHHILVALRNLRRNKGSFIVNLLGLSFGLGSVLLIYMWVYDELSYDQFHTNKNRLYEVMQNMTDDQNMIRTSENNSDLLAPALLQERPEVEYAVPVSAPFSKGTLSTGQTRIKATGKFAGKEFFKIFSYKILEGNREQLLQQKGSIVISDELAIKLFGRTTNVANSILTWDEDPYTGTYMVSGVFKKEYKSSEQFDFLLSNELFLEKRPADFIGWHSNSVHVYLLLRDDAVVSSFNADIAGFVKDKFKALYGPENLKYMGTLFIRPYSEKYLYDHYDNGVQKGGRIDYVILFSVVALFILLIASINFMNLYTAQASRRTKEVGVKKAVGAQRKLLVYQYISEAMVMAFVSFVLAVVAVILLLPNFNLLTGKQLMLHWDMKLIAGALIIVFVTGIMSGSYPALYLSGFRPAEALKGKFKTSGVQLWVRRGLVIFQFCISILLIISVIVVYQQISFVQSKNLGYEKNNVIVFDRQGKLKDGIETFLSEARNTPGVLHAATIGYEIGRPSNLTGAVEWEGKTGNVEFGGLNVGQGLIELMGIQIKEGRSFADISPTESSKIIFNELAIQSMGLKNPIGKTVILWGQQYEITGIANNFHFQSLHETLKPCFLRLTPDNNSIAIKIQSGTEKETIARLKKLYGQFNPDLSFDFKFIDDEYQTLYVSEQKVRDLAFYFASIAIVISCLGLFALASFSAERRSKELGIRKILGCSEFGLVYLLSSDFTKMVLFAIAISLPLGYFLSAEWLENFAYRVDLKLYYFLGAGLSTLLMAWCTVATQAIRAARINPTESLKTE